MSLRRYGNYVLTTSGRRSRHRVAVACATAFAATLQVGMAHAHVDVCAGTGTMSTSKGLYYVPDYQYNVDYTLTLPGACAASGTRAPMIHGTFTQAACGQTIGYAYVDGHAATGVSTGGVWIVAGAAVGAFLLIPQGSCVADGTNPGVSSFLVVGAFATV